MPPPAEIERRRAGKAHHRVLGGGVEDLLAMGPIAVDRGREHRSAAA